jgi:hypothetical protein
MNPAPPVIRTLFIFLIDYIYIIQKKESLDNSPSSGLSCTPLALCPEARNRAGVTHPHHLLLG